MNRAKQPKHPLDRWPTSFSVVLFPALSDEVRYRVEGGSLLRQVGEVVEHKVQPANARWFGFWRFCQFLDLWQWRAEYDAWDIGHQIRDGQDWSLDIALEGIHEIRTQGRNAYPALEDSQTTAATQDRFGLLLHGIDNMLISREVHPWNDYSNSDLREYPFHPPRQSD